ncbi:MAG: DUF6366 family protein, partial [Clostridium sp.]
NNSHEREDKRIRDEYSQRPEINFSNGVNRSEIGDLAQVSRNGWKVNLIIIAVLIGIYIYMKYK